VRKASANQAGYQPAAGCQPAPQRNGVCGRGENMGTDRSVHPAPTRVMLSRNVVAALGQSGQSPRFRSGERGYALLAVFLMAAMIAMYLYMQLPRVAFESERDKEQSLIDAGEQYKRAIQLYVAAVKKYPQKIEDLENTNNKRYLRKRYIDPMTGKDEWRLVHVNAAGVLTDSLVTKPPTADGKPSDGTLGTNSMVASGTSSGTTDPANPTGAAAADPNDVNAAVRRRPSDVVGQAYTAPATVDPNDPRTWAPITIAPTAGTGTGPATGLPPSGAVGFNGGLPGQVPAQGFPGQFPGQAGMPGVPGGTGGPGGFPLPGQPGFNPNQNQFKIDANGQLVPVTPTQTGAVINSQTGGVQNTPVPGQQPASGPNGINTAGNSLATQNAATAAINQMLQNPNPQPGAAGLGTAGGMTTGGIAGVASMYKGPSIKVYGGRQKYQEWEFIFSLNDQRGGPNGQRNPLQNGSQGTGAQPGAGGAPPLGSSTGTPTVTPTGNP
jgi:hypothetical protein